MESAEAWSTPWSRRRAAQRSDLCDMAQVRDEIPPVFRQLLSRTLLGPKPRDLSLEIIATKRQSASLLQRTEEAAILFDLSQSMILKHLFDLVRHDKPYDDFAIVLGAGAGLAIADDSPGLCSALLSFSVPTSEAHYPHDEAPLLDFYRTFLETLPRMLFEWQASLIDGYILAHEVSHYLLVRPDKTMSWLRSGAESAFAFAMDQVCYERHPNFPEIAQHGGLLSKTPDALHRLRLDLANRRRHYEANREHMVEEIACDAYGLLVARITHESVWKADAADPDAVLDGYLRLAETYMLLLALSDLHQAMIKRAKLSVSAGIESEKPGDIADMHFRKMALIYAMAEQALVHLPSEMRNEEAFQTLLSIFAQRIGRHKQCIDALIVMPVTRVIREQIVRFEQTAGTTPVNREVGKAASWRGHDLGRLFGHKRLQMTFSESAVRELTGA